jgi:hypothetical protein
MFYEFDLTVPKNTLQTAPVELTVQLAPGVITYGEIQFPRGCIGLVHACIRDRLHQYAPANPAGDIAAENARISWSDEYPIDEQPWELVLCGWNEDDTFSHTLTFRLSLTPEHIWERQQQALAALDYLARWFSQAPAT